MHCETAHFCHYWRFKIEHFPKNVGVPPRTGEFWIRHLSSIKCCFVKPSNDNTNLFCRNCRGVGEGVEVPFRHSENDEWA